MKVPCGTNLQESLPLSRNGSSRKHRESPAHCLRWKYFRGERKELILNKLLPVVTCLICLCSFAPLQLAAQDSQPKEAETQTIRATHLDEVVEVIADKVEATLLETPSTINIITAQDIRQSGQRELSGILTAIPGVFDDGSGATYFNFRGTRSSMSEGAAIYLDGRPLNVGRHDYSAIDDIPIDIVERVEVVKSPAASLYGANSARGVINIITRSRTKAAAPFEKSISLGIGAWQTYTASASISAKRSRLNYAVQINRDRSQGYRHTDPKRTFLSGHAGYKIADGIDLDLTLGWDDSWKKSPTSLAYWALGDREQNEPPNQETGGAYRIRPNEMDHRLLSSGISFKYERRRWLVVSTIDFSHYDDLFSYLRYFNNPGNSTSQRGQGSYTEDRNENKADFKSSIGRDFSYGERLHSTITFGYDYAFTAFNQERRYPYTTSPGTTTINNIRKNALDFSRKIDGIFISNDLKFGNWGLTAGLRQDFVFYEVGNRVPDNVMKSFREASWDIAPSCHLTKNSNLYFFLGRNYWYPVAHYFTAAMDYDDPLNQPGDLQVEKYLNYELGFKQRVSKNLNYSVALYRSDIDNKYMPYYSDRGSFKGYKHIGKSVHQGIEIAADGRPRNWFGYRIGFSWIDAEWDKASTPVAVYGTTPDLDVVSIVDISGKKLFRVPDCQYLAGMSFHPLQKLSLSLDIHGRGRQYIDAYNRYRGNAVNLVDFKASYILSKEFEFYILGSNIFDAYYENIINTAGARTSAGVPDNEYYPGNGRYFEAGIKVRL